MALTSVQTLVERHPTFEKTVPMKLRFLTHWYKLTEEEKKQAIPNEKERETAV